MQLDRTLNFDITFSSIVKKINNSVTSLAKLGNETQKVVNLFLVFRNKL